MAKKSFAARTTLHYTHSRIRYVLNFDMKTFPSELHKTAIDMCTPDTKRPT